MVQWQLNPERTALLRFTDKANSATHALYQLFTDGQAKTGTAFLPAVARVGLGKFLENASCEIRGYSRPLVTHQNAHRLPLNLAVKANLPLRWRKLQCIGQQIAQHLLQTLSVSQHLQVWAIGMQ